MPCWRSEDSPNTNLCPSIVAGKSEAMENTSRAAPGFIAREGPRMPREAAAGRRESSVESTLGPLKIRAHVLHQVALDEGSLESAALLLQRPDPINRPVFGGTQAELETGASHRKALRRLDRARQDGGGKGEGKKAKNKGKDGDLDGGGGE